MITVNVVAVLNGLPVNTENLDRLADRVFDISTMVLAKYRRIRKAIQ